MKRLAQRLLIAGMLTFATMDLGAIEPIEGYWLAPSKNDKSDSTVVRFYPYEKHFYGKIVAGVDSSGNLVEDLSSGTVGVGADPYFRLSMDGDRWAGIYIDPSGGGEFNLKIHRSGSNLIVRFELKGFSFLGHERVWKPLDEKQQARLEKTSGEAGPPRRP